jgi:hypothetical protein
MSKPHTMEEDFQHFLSYSNLSGEGADVLAKLRKAYEANWRAAPMQQQGQPIADVSALRDAVAESLRGNYYCGRVWSAWGFGTMSEADFSPSEEVDECIDQVMDAVRPFLASAADVSAPTDERAAFEAAVNPAKRTQENWEIWQAARAAAPVSGQAAQEQAVSVPSDIFTLVKRKDDTEVWLQFDGGMVCLNNIANERGPITRGNMARAIQRFLTAPPAPTAQPLTDAEIFQIADKIGLTYNTGRGIKLFAREVERHLTGTASGEVA